MAFEMPPTLGIQSERLRLAGVVEQGSPAHCQISRTILHHVSRVGEHVIGVVKGVLMEAYAGLQHRQRLCQYGGKRRKIIGAYQRKKFA